MPTFEMTTPVTATADELFAYHDRRGALARLTPPFDRVRAVREIDRLEDGARATIEMAVGPVWTRWVADHQDVVPGRGFVDVMQEGPFSAWRHEHIFEPRAEGAVLVDRITFEVPAGALGTALAADAILDKLQRSFTFRHTTTRLDLALFRALPSRRLVVGITGASGLIGREVTSLLQAAGHSVKRFVRGTARPDGGDVQWDPGTGELGAGADGLDAVVHLAGEPVAEHRLNAAQRQRVRDSRVGATQRLVESLGALPRPPRAFISASAVGIYGNRGDAVLDEQSAGGTGFLAEICAGWEQAALSAEQHGMRAASLRIGLVLSPAGGALGKMMLPFQAGLGARLGDGRQWMPVVSVDDVAAMFYRGIVDERVRGPLNAVGKEPITNATFTHLLGEVLHRPAALAVPRFAARALFGTGVADEALLTSQRAVPAKLSALGHAFRHETAEAALRHVLGKPSRASASVTMSRRSTSRGGRAEHAGTHGTPPSFVPRP